MVRYDGLRRIREARYVAKTAATERPSYPTDTDSRAAYPL
jgi:hypothetical protein